MNGECAHRVQLLFRLTLALVHLREVCAEVLGDVLESVRAIAVAGDATCHISTLSGASKTALKGLLFAHLGACGELLLEQIRFVKHKHKTRMSEELVGAYGCEELQRVVDPVRTRIFFEVLQG